MIIWTLKEREGGFSIIERKTNQLGRFCKQSGSRIKQKVWITNKDEYIMKE